MCLCCVCILFYLLHVHLGERYPKLLAVLQMTEREKTRQASAAQNLQERLTRAQEEISSLQASITERSSHYQQLHNQLLDKATQSTSLEKEVSVPLNPQTAVRKHKVALYEILFVQNLCKTVNETLSSFMSCSSFTFKWHVVDKHVTFSPVKTLCNLSIKIVFIS